VHDNGKKAQDDFRPHIIVKFNDDIKLSNDGRINLEELIPGLWDDIVRDFPGISIEKLFTSVEPARIKELQSQAVENDPSYKPTNLLSYFVVYYPPQINPLLLVERLSALEIVEEAYVVPGYEEPSSVNPEDDLPGYLEDQDYLGPAPDGIDVEFAWNQPGGDGSGQRLIDFEQGWKRDHEDLVYRPYNLLYGMNRDASNHHGTAVLGVICACDNDKGCIGIVPNASSVDLVSYHSVIFSDALLQAIINLKFGDMLLIEAQTLGTQLPVESLSVNFDIIKLATALGIVVIECAGNAGVDLDSHPETRHLSRTNPIYDSGAIMVGAATSTVPHQREDGTMPACNYGSRIDCYAWGQNVWTTWWPRVNIDPPDRFYVNFFDATSAAGAIIAGAALSLQGMAEQSLRRRLSPGEMRTRLADPATGTPAYHNGVQDAKLGYMPNLQAIIIHNLPCIYIRDFVNDTGYPHNGPISASPDIIVLPNAVADPQASFGQGSGTENSDSLGSSIVMGQDNYIYVRINNLGSSTAANVVAHVYWSEVASLITPDMWNEIGSVQIPDVAPSVLTVSNALQWASGDIPAAGHYCFICIIGSSGAPAPNPANFRDFDNYYRFIRENNKVTWRNFNVVSNVGPLSGELAGFVNANFLVVSAHDKDREMELEFSPQLPIGAKVSIEMPATLARLVNTDLTGIDPDLIEYDDHKRIARIPLNANERQTIIKAILPAKERYPVKLYIHIPEEFGHKDYTVSVSQKYKDLEVGGVTWKLVRMVEKF
jgi:serine protease